jgi:hypothetical protein
MPIYFESCNIPKYFHSRTISLASLESQFQKQFGKDKIAAIRAFGK